MLNQIVDFFEFEYLLLFKIILNFEYFLQL